MSDAAVEGQLLDELHPVEDDEFILRLVLRAFYKPYNTPPIEIQCFRPTDRDIDGLSVFREKYLQQPTDALGAIPEAKRGLYGIARLSVRLLRSLGLSLRPNPIPQVPGHALIVELNRPAYEADRERAQKLLTVLATAASADLVLIPPMT